MGKAIGLFLVMAGGTTFALLMTTFESDESRLPVSGVTDPISVAPAPSYQAQPAFEGSTPQRISEVTAPPPPSAITRNSATAAVRPTDARLRADLTRDIQRELKRVGCYKGELDGEWSPGTRRAMKSFVQGVNATLPIDAPDTILQTMVRGHPGDACGTACAKGHTAVSDGRCLPTVIVQHSDDPTRSTWKTVVKPRDAPRARETAAVPKSVWDTIGAIPPPPQDRMALGGAVGRPAMQKDIPLAAVLGDSADQPLPEKGLEQQSPAVKAASASAPATEANNPGREVSPAPSQTRSPQVGSRTAQSDVVKKQTRDTDRTNGRNSFAAQFFERMTSLR